MPDLTQFIKSLVPRQGLGWVIKVKGAGGTEFVHRSFVHDRVLSQVTNEVAIDFEYEFDTTPELNAGIVKLYNLDNRRIEEFPKGGPLELKAAWQGLTEETLLVMHGTVDAVEDYVEGEKRAFKIYFTDGPEVYKSISARTWKPGVSYSKVFLDLAKDTGLKVKVFNPAVDKVYRTGMNVFGPTWPAMRMVARDMRSKLYVFNREIYLLKPDGVVGPEVTWSYVTGLQKLQRAVTLTQDARNKLQFAKYEPATHRIKNLFTPEIGPDAVINLLGEEFGRYRVVRGIHKCDGKEYITEVDAVKLDMTKTQIKEFEAIQGKARAFQAQVPL